MTSWPIYSLHQSRWWALGIAYWLRGYMIIKWVSLQAVYNYATLGRRLHVSTTAYISIVSVSVIIDARARCDVATYSGEEWQRGGKCRRDDGNSSSRRRLRTADIVVSIIVDTVAEWWSHVDRQSCRRRDQDTTNSVAAAAAELAVCCNLRRDVVRCSVSGPFTRHCQHDVVRLRVVRSLYCLLLSGNRQHHHHHLFAKCNKKNTIKSHS